MEADFWHERWENKLTGFHLDEVNPLLTRYWSQLSLPRKSRVFVPLCGKSLDLIWLSQQGHQVVAVELSGLAVSAFFAENNLTPEQKVIGKLECWTAENITIYCGNFFDLTADILGNIDAVFDRASLIALPTAMREEYAAKLHELTPSAVKMLITLEYEQSKMDGPPFSVTGDEVNSLYQNNYDINQMFSVDIIDENERFKARGLEYLHESVLKLIPII
ncbi:MAG: thiopurine S-methyltransferase [Woeseiaceae bacterium]